MGILVCFREEFLQRIVADKDPQIYDLLLVHPDYLRKRFPSLSVPAL